MPALDRGTSATQVVSRVAELMAALAAAEDGARLIDLATATGIARPSVHRILRDLIEVDYVEQRPDKRYTLGPAIFDLSLHAPSPILDFEALRVAARRAADASGDTVYVSLRRLDGIHYLVREDGRYPIRAHIVDEGDIKALTSSYGGIALLAHADPAVREQALRHPHADSPENTLDQSAGDRRALLEAKIDQVLRDGYLTGSNLVMPGLSGVAVPVPSRQRAPYVAISISAIDQRLPPGRLPEIVAVLQRAAAEIGEAIR